MLLVAVLEDRAAATFPGKNGRIAFVSDRSGHDEIYTMNAKNGSGLTQLTNQPTGGRDPSYSPNGKKIVFASFRSGNFEIYTMNAKNGSGLTQLTHNPADDFDADWGVRVR